MRNPLSNVAHGSDVVASVLHEIAHEGRTDKAFIKGHPGKGLSTMKFGMPRLLGRAEAIGLNSEGQDRAANIATEQFTKGSALCESPIERGMLAGLLTGDWGDIGALPPLVHDASRGSKEPLPQAPVVIVPQMAFVHFRLDFAIVVVKDRRLQVIGLECDGKEFHQDAVKESTRVAYLNSWNIPVFKFSGSQIYDDPINAADTVITGIHGWWAS